MEEVYAVSAVSDVQGVIVPSQVTCNVASTLRTTGIPLNGKYQSQALPHNDWHQSQELPHIGWNFNSTHQQHTSPLERDRQFFFSLPVPRK